MELEFKSLDHLNEVLCHDPNKTNQRTSVLKEAHKEINQSNQSFMVDQVNLQFTIKYNAMMQTL